MVARTRLNVTVYVHCLPVCFNFINDQYITFNKSFKHHLLLHSETSHFAHRAYLCVSCDIQNTCNFGNSFSRSYDIAEKDLILCSDGIKLVHVP